MSEMLVWSSISILLALCRPSNIATLVVAFVVLPIQTVLWCWLHAEFSEKFFKRSEPELNSTSAIVLIAGAFRATASSLCAHIRLIFRSHFPPDEMPMSCFQDSVSSQASATLNLTAPKTSPVDYFFGAADAKTEPFSLAFGIHSVEANNHKPVKLLARNVDKIGMTLYLGISHLVSDLHRMLFGESRIGIGVPCGSLALYPTWSGRGQR